MANPNIVSVQTIRGMTTVRRFVKNFSIPLINNAASSQQIIKVNSLYVTHNNSNRNATVNVFITLTTSTGTIPIVNSVFVPVGTTFNPLQKSRTIYVGEGESLNIRATANDRISVVCSYEQISDSSVSDRNDDIVETLSPITDLFNFTTHTFTNGGVNNHTGTNLTTFRTAYAAQEWAQDTEYFNVVNGAQFWKVPADGTYRITVAGAGGATTFSSGGTGGRGVIIRGLVNLVKEDILRIVVGTRGGRYDSTGGGGGASHVVKVLTMTSVSNVGITVPLIMSGGGGGAGNSGGNGVDAIFGSTQPQNGYGGHSSGVNGNGGNPVPNSSSGGWGVAGCGWYSAGGGNSNINHGDWSGSEPGDPQNGANNFFEGTTASHGTGYTQSLHDFQGSGGCVGAPGGFGGGGGGQCNGGGGGAGWNGGAAGGVGGASFVDTTQVSSRSNVGYSSADTNGYVIIEKYDPNNLNITTTGMQLRLNAGNTSSYSGTGTTWNDLSGNSFNGTLQNGVGFNYLHSGALTFDGSNDTVSVVKPNPNITGQITMSIWVYFNNFSSSPVLIHKGSHYTFQLSANQGTHYWTYADSTNWNYASFGYRFVNGLYETGVWMNLVVTKDASNNVRLYKNGVLVDTRTSFGSAITSVNSTLFISGYSDTDTLPSTNILNGRVGEVLIYNRALNDVEVLDNYDATRNRYLTAVNVVTSGLTVYLDAGNPASYPGSGSTWTDLSGNGNNMTLYNSPTFSTNNGGVLQFNGSNQYGQIAGLNYSTSNFTIIAGTRYTGSPQGRVVTSINNNWLFGHWSSYTEAYYAEGWIHFGPTGDTNWRIYTGTENYSSGQRNFYVNNTLRASGGGSQGFNGLSLGTWSTGSEWSACQASFILIYNRVLTTQEIAQNFNAYRIRFGL